MNDIMNKVEELVEKIQSNKSLMEKFEKDPVAVLEQLLGVAREGADRVPILGTIACGAPILAQEHIEGYTTIPEDISADFALTKGDTGEIWAKMKELIGKRTASQPLDLPSAGSAFKRPVGGYAAALIDEAGLKGYQVGGAAISAKHAGFAVNLGSATAEDVKQLLYQVSDQVFEKSGIRLEPEVRIW